MNRLPSRTSTAAVPAPDDGLGQWQRFTTSESVLSLMPTVKKRRGTGSR